MTSFSFSFTLPRPIKLGDKILDVVYETIKMSRGYYIQTTSSLGTVTQSISENRLERESGSKYLPTRTQEKLYFMSIVPPIVIVA